MRIIVCGGRNAGRTNPNATHFQVAAKINRATNERNFVTHYLAKLHADNPITMVIAGKKAAQKE